MTKQVTITMPNWFWEMYISGVTGNRSEYICGNFIKGYDYETSGQDTRNAIIIRVEQENRELSQKVKKLEFELLKYSHKKPKMSMNARITKGLVMSGWNAENS